MALSITSNVLPNRAKVYAKYSSTLLEQLSFVSQSRRELLLVAPFYDFDRDRPSRESDAGTMWTGLNHGEVGGLWGE